MIELLNENTNLLKESFKIPAVVNNQLDLINAYNKEYVDDLNYFSSKIDRYDEFEIVITVPNLTKLNEIQLTLPELKYDKKFVYSMSSDDSHHGIYNQVQNFVNGRYVPLTVNDGHDQIHDDITLRGTGFIPPRRYGYTDGVSTNIIPFRVSANLIPNDVSNTAGTQNPYLSWPEITRFMDFYGSIGYHESGLHKTGLLYNNGNLSVEFMRQVQIDENVTMLKNKNIEPTTLQIANGNPLFVPIFRSYLPYVYSETNESSTSNQSGSNEYISLSGITSLRKLAFLRKFTNVDLTNSNVISYLTTKQQSTPYSVTFYGTHEVPVTESDYTNNTTFTGIYRVIDETWGASGNNTVWGCAPDELFQWLFTKNYTKIEKRIDTTNLTAYFHVTVPHLKNTIHDQISLVCNQITSMNDVTTLKNYGEIYNDNYGIVNGRLLININYDKTIITRLDTYLKIAESKVLDSLIGEYLADAEFFYNMLSSDRKLYHNFKSRYEAIALPPTVTSVVLNDDATATANSTLKVSLGFNGSPTHYLVSEYISFSGATWKYFNKDLGYFNYTLTDTSVGTKRLYVKLKNAGGASDYVRSNGIQFLGTNVIDISSVVINSGQTTTLTPTVSVKINTVNLTPGKYRLSLDSNTLSSSSWITGSTSGETYTSNSITAPFVLPSIGSHTIYAQVSDTYGVTNSTIQNDSIQYATVSLDSLFVNSGASETTASTVTIDYTYSGTPTKYMISDSGNYTNELDIVSSPFTFNLTPTAGVKTIGMKVKDGLTTSGLLTKIITFNPDLIVNTFSIPSQTVSTNTVNITLDVPYATHMRFGTSSVLSGVTWETYSTGKTYTLPTVAGDYTIYGEFKHPYKTTTGNTGVIHLTSQASLSYVLLESGSTSTSNIPISVNMTYSGTPTEMILSENSSFTGATWVAFNSGTTYTVSPTTGTKTVYVKLRDVNSIETTTVSDSIDYVYVAPARKTIISFVGGSNSTIVNQVTGGTNIGQYYNQVYPRRYEQASDFSLVDTMNVSIGTLIVRPSLCPVDMGEFYDNSAFSPTLSGNLGSYPDSMMSVSRIFPLSGVDLTYKPGFRLSGMPNGTYNIKIWGPAGSNALGTTDYNNQVYTVNGTSKNPTQNMLNNSTYYLTFDNVIINNGNIDFYISRLNTLSTQTSINLVELIKID